MNDAQLDRKLNIGKEQARRFFDGHAQARVERAGRRSLRPRVWRQVCFACASVVAAAAVCAAIVVCAGVTGVNQTAQPTKEALTEQTVYLGEDKAYRMNYIPVAMPDADAALMTVLWETRDDAKPEMAYYSLFETCDTGYPALTISFPDPDYDMLLIASGDSARGSLGYRLIGYSGDALSTWWAQDRVPDGNVALRDGVAVERRAYEDGEGEAVTYIVPIQVMTPGRVALPVNALHMNVGERILLIGGGAVDATSQSGLLGAEQQPETSLSALLLKALSAGEDVLRIGQNAQLAVDIEE